MGYCVVKRVTYNDILDFDKIMREYHNIRSKTRNKKKLCNFEVNLGSNVLNMLNMLKNKKWKHNTYNVFIISEPKYRIIMSEKLNDKIVNHLVSQYVLLPLLEPKLIDANVATRKNKGTSYGLKLAYKFMNKLKENYDEVYVLKIDIKKYFFNIDHDILLKKLRQFIKDDDLFLLISNIIRSSDETYVNRDIIKTKRYLQRRIRQRNIENKQLHLNDIEKLPLYQKGKGLPIGNLSSQILAIFYLNDVDHYIKETLKIKYYVRYMDDFLIFHYDKEYLKKCLRNIEGKIKELKLTLNEKTNIYNLKQGVSFLGYRFKLKDKKLIVRINNQTKQRIKKKIKNLKIYDKEKLGRVQASYKGYLQYSNCHIMHIIK